MLTAPEGSGKKMDTHVEGQQGLFIHRDNGK